MDNAREAVARAIAEAEGDQPWNEPKPRHYAMADAALAALPAREPSVAEAVSALVVDGRRWRVGSETGNVFDPDDDFDGITLTVEIRSAQEARDIAGAALSQDGEPGNG